MKALSDAAAILRQAGDTTHAQALDERVHAILRAERSVCNSTRLFLTARSLQRAEAEAREREEAEREDARKKELDALYRCTISMFRPFSMYTCRPREYRQGAIAHALQSFSFTDRSWYLRKEGVGSRHEEKDAQTGGREAQGKPCVCTAAFGGRFGSPSQ